MMHAKWMGRIVLALLPLVGAAAQSQEAFTRQSANVRAGPDRSYPLVSQLGPGAPVQVMGCLDDWSWCDVAFDDNRGWVYGPFLLYGVPDDRVSLYTYGPSLGIPIIVFSLGPYWDDHYRHRPWYGGRDEWSHREPPPHRAPAGLPPHAVYTPGMHPNRGGNGPQHTDPPGRPQGAQQGSEHGPGRSGQQGPPRGPEHVAQPGPARAAEPARAPEHDPQRGPARPPEHAAEQSAPRGPDRAAQPGPGPEHGPAGARPGERGTAPGAEAGMRSERTTEPQPNRSAPREMQHAPVGAREAEGQREGGSGAERGGEKPGREDNR
jgi:uncharacterized protein YraI